MSKFTYYAASYYYRYGDPLGTAVALCKAPIVNANGTAQLVEAAVEKACDYQDMMSDDGVELPIAGQAFTYRPRDLFTAAELREHRRALLAGEVVWLAR